MVLKVWSLSGRKALRRRRRLRLKIDGFFLAIGHTPNSDVFKNFLKQMKQDILKQFPATTKTNVPGIFAAGDVQDPVYRQAVTAAGSGCMAAIDAERYLSELHS